MAAAAAAKGYRVLGFSSHSPLPFPNEGNMELSRLGEYCAEIRRIGREWGDRGLEVLLGLEIEWVEGLSSPRDRLFREAGLDYSIGSLHFVDLPGPGRFAVDLGLEEFGRSAAAFAGDDFGRAVISRLLRTARRPRRGRRLRHPRPLRPRQEEQRRGAAGSTNRRADTSTPRSAPPGSYAARISSSRSTSAA